MSTVDDIKTILKAHIKDAYFADDIVPAVRRRLLTSHFSLKHAKQMLQANDLSTVREIHLLHLSNENSDHQYFKTEIQKLTGKPVYIATDCPGKARPGSEWQARSVRERTGKNGTSMAGSDRDAGWTWRGKARQ